jgi:predicted acyl esterase
MDDGVELAATLYLPEPPTGPQPCILEALPYRKDDLTASYRPDYVRFRDEYGYAVCRLDLRGTGSSGGDAVDEYPPREEQDLHATIQWLADQAWCDGNIGMYGTSYSGFNSLQMACERPEHLRAIISIFASDNRYTDDVHYREPWLFTWLEHQVLDSYWEHGSVRPDYDRITCPTMIVTGWADGYHNIAYRMAERLRANRVPHRLLAGPWSHAATDTAQPGPRIDSVPEMAAWWDRWLRGIDNGVDTGLSDDSPAMTCFIRSSTRPSAALDTSEGEWIREQWPSPRVSQRVLNVASRPPYAVRPDVGVDAWIDCAGHLPWGQSSDQRFDDGASLTWDWDADDLVPRVGSCLMEGAVQVDASARPRRKLRPGRLRDDANFSRRFGETVRRLGGERRQRDFQHGALIFVGHPRLALRVSFDAPAAYLSAKLCDVFEDGTSALVCRGTRNLGLNDDLTSQRPLEPGREYEVAIELDACAYRFAPGQRLRLAIAGSDWPNTAAPPRPVTLTMHGGRLELPVWQGPSRTSRHRSPRELSRPKTQPASPGGSSATYSSTRRRVSSTTAPVIQAHTTRRRQSTTTGG